MRKFFICLFVFMLSAFAWAGTDPAQIATDATSFFTEVIVYIHGFGGQTWLFKVSSIVMLAVAVVKTVPFLSGIWTALEGKQVWLAPLLGLLGGILTLAMAGTPITFAALVAYATAGAGGMYLYELLDLLKLIPGIGPFWVSLIGIAEGALGAGAKPVAAK